MPKSLQISKLMRQRQKDAVSTLDTQKCAPRLIKQNRRGVFLVCFWGLALWEDILLSFSAVRPLLLRLIFTLSLNCCVFVVVSVCPSVCSGEIGARESTFSAPKVADNRFSMSLPGICPPHFKFL